MNKRTGLSLFFVIFLVPSHIKAQTVASILPRALGGSAIPTASASRIDTTRVKNRSHLSGSTVNVVNKTLYFSVGLKDIHGEISDSALRQLLTPPPIRKGEGIRKVEIDINLQQRPIKLKAAPGETLNIASPIIEAGVKNIEVIANVSGVIIIAK